MTPELTPLAADLRRHDRDRFLTTLFAPAARREALVALYGFNLEVARIREMVREPMLGQIRLQWWREGIEGAYQGEVRHRHDSLDRLVPAIAGFGLTRSYFDRLIDARERDLAPEAPEDAEALISYCRDTAATLVWLALEMLEAASPAALKAGEHVGIAFAVAGLLRAIPFHARAGRMLVPASLAAGAGLDPQSVLAMRCSAPLRSCVAELAALAAAHLAEARLLRREVPRAALPALLPARLAERHLARLRRAGHDPFDPGLPAPDGVRAWLLGYAALTGRY